ncbi:hypothetical protein [Amycolatopsis sp. NPDC059021]|uniref:hypothetical protein n=1 Tax=Amycolatopsis sp. NPDC059021 TaxID=3346704 RepID=UPI00366A73A0
MRNDIHTTPTLRIDDLETLDAPAMGGGGGWFNVGAFNNGFTQGLATAAAAGGAIYAFYNHG